MFVANENFETVDFDACVALMDDELREEAHRTTVLNADYERISNSEQYFFDLYCGLHRRKYGEEFEPNKRNGVW